MIRWLTAKVAYLSTWWGLKFGCGVVGAFPNAVFWLSDRLADVGYHCFGGFRNRSIANLRIALGDQVDRPTIDVIVRRSLQNFFRACVEIAVAIKASDQELRSYIPLVGSENLDAALAKGKGVLALSAHLGNFFLVGSRLAVEGYPAFVVVNQPRDGRFAKLMDDYRLQTRQRTIHARPRRDALRELSTVLRDNHVAVMIADEFRRGNGVEVPFFGGTVIARRGPVTLALRTGAAIVPICLIRHSDNSLALVIEPELELERASKGPEQIKENTIRMTQWLERTVRAHPDQWNWMNIRWWANRKNPLVDHEQEFRHAI
ncbi:MAG TPA: lysophospholipid acyltransferase family protein [Acidobacteriota bacterium]|nr:lysophospholipid acyltransferase family protein [Acidobacteriota bacterium]